MSYPEPCHLGDTGETSATDRPAGAAPDLVLWTDATGGDYPVVPPGGIHAFHPDRPFV
jgi:hypothetical protein